VNIVSCPTCSGGTEIDLIATAHEVERGSPLRRKSRRGQGLRRELPGERASGFRLAGGRARRSVPRGEVAQGPGGAEVDALRS
jgi:hypothetical protein